MDSPPEDLAAALNELPLFVLHQAVLFPGVLLPLHVFERRYRQLVRDALASHRALAVAHVPDPSADMAGNPPIAEIAGVGTIVEHVELPGGRFNILLRGRARVRLQELRFVAPYRRALATWLSEPEQPVKDRDLAALHAAISSFVRLVRQREPAFRMSLPKGARPGAIADACAARLVIDARDRQNLLETLQEDRRVRKLTEILTVQSSALGPERSGREQN